MKKLNEALFFLLCTVFMHGVSLSQADATRYKYTGSNLFDRNTDFFAQNTSPYAGGFSAYSAVWAMFDSYPGRNAISSSPHTWMENRSTNVPGYPQNEKGKPDLENYRSVIEGGLGWWSDTRFGTEIPKFIMGGVVKAGANNGYWANGVSAGSGDQDHTPRNWDEPGGKYGVAQLSPYVLWPPDGLNMSEEANGDYLGYGYHPLPITDPMSTTEGASFRTGNQCWTLFLNTGNFKGPVAFFLPTHWTKLSAKARDFRLEGLFLDSSSPRECVYGVEHIRSPALMDQSNTNARILPLRYPKTSSNVSEVLRDQREYAKSAMWNNVEAWFNGGPVAPTAFQVNGTREVLQTSNADWNMKVVPGDTDGFPIIPFARKASFSNGKVAGLVWDLSKVEEKDGFFEIPEYYNLHSGKWYPQKGTGSQELLESNPPTDLRDPIPYLTPKESDCECSSASRQIWSKSAAGPFTAKLGDGSVVTYYWFKFRDQPAVVNANLPKHIVDRMQERVEKIHRYWKKTDTYLADPSGGSLVGLDQGLIVDPPAGMEIGYVPIVTRQESAESAFVQLIPNGTYNIKFETETFLGARSNNEVWSNTNNAWEAENQWVITHVSNNEYTIKNASTNNTLYPAGCAQRDKLYTGSSSTFKWKAERKGSANQYFFKPVGCEGNLALDKWSTSNQAHLWSFDPNNGNQFFSLTQPAPFVQLIESGTYNIKFGGEILLGARSNNTVWSNTDNSWDTKNQWVITHKGNNEYTVKNVGTNYVLYAETCQQYGKLYTGTLSETKWKAERRGSSDQFFFKPVGCEGNLALDKWSTSNQAHLWSFDPNNGNQYFSLTQPQPEPFVQLIQNGIYNIQGIEHYEYVSKLTDNEDVKMRTYWQAIETESSLMNAQWEFTHLGDNVYAIKNRGNNKYLGVYGFGTANGTDVKAIDQNADGTNRQWVISKKANGNTYFLKPKHAQNSALDRSIPSQGNVKIWSYLPNNNQEFYIAQNVGNFTPLLSDGSIAYDAAITNDLNLSVYPIPASEIVNVVHSLNDNFNLQFRIFAMSGKEIQVGNLSTSNTIDVSKIQCGVYLLSLTNGKTKVYAKFIKK